ncbi:hypothetical protein O181_063540 [Austropuccinia psidii MF-1]|uniref:Integral membrane protein n=1 Tax=Austropuccinia psidii MF-1 TaxID=1389203 RepID=A0A9Q3I2A8_9BASI|nr:hypothetical protein [Austropuccinia psidii MF-1]
MAQRSLTAGILITGMLITGCSNSLWSKFQDKQCVRNCGDPDPSRHEYFEQPVWQTLNMFIGEACCMIAFYLIKSLSRSSQLKTSTPKGYAYSPIPRDSNDHSVGTADEFQSAQQSSDDFNHQSTSSHLSQQLTEPTHIKLNPDSTNPLAVHGPATTPIPTAIEPTLLVGQHEPAIVELVGLQKLVFWLPTMFDICGTTLMNAGLLFVPVSVFQMVRGALPLWVGLFSIIFLNRTLSRDKWLSLLVITFGVALVGFAGSLQSKVNSDETTHSPTDQSAQVVLGLFLIFFAQLFTASQFVIEEKIMTKYEIPPLEAVGLEGVFGLLTTLIAIPILHIFIGSSPSNRGGYFDATTALDQIVSNPALLLSSVAIAISIALFNFCGLAVTKTISATVRSVIDTCRSIGIWGFSLIIGWETFNSLQLIGFIVLVIGTFLFNDILKYPNWFYHLIGSRQVHVITHNRID